MAGRPTHRHRRGIGVRPRAWWPTPGHQVADIQVFVSSDPASAMGDEASCAPGWSSTSSTPTCGTTPSATEPYGARQISQIARDATVPGTGGEAVGLAQVVGQVGRGKPDARTPFAGLYLVGCDAGGRGSGTHQAVDSGFHVAAMVGEDLRQPPPPSLPGPPPAPRRPRVMGRPTIERTQLQCESWPPPCALVGSGSDVWPRGVASGRGRSVSASSPRRTRA